ncbi:UDP-N-acetylmuramoyl-L-alanyl-D-glutamate--2,6-diaminopimelate ligase, partial [Candidatus Bipolaricaulota bacterium]|nr:UDP-N-acetylmuramoyl-L-alanyl-D-glutamate--2,6-diaminopimelate ligase [Candidatus Bipolaricaulota bacterium]
ELIVVFGAPGESDPGKRPLMGKAVGEYADLAIVTSDNPKGEDPAEIAVAVARGLEEAGAAYEVELDRKRAIERALELAGPGDIVLIAGKGHERHQLVRGRKIPHSDVDYLLAQGGAAL